MNITIRHATEDDCNQVGAIFADENRFHAELLPDRFRIADPIMTREWFNEIISNAGKALFVAEFKNELIGLVLVNLMTSPDDPVFQPRRYAYVDEATVIEQYRGRGVGQLLFAEVHKWLLEQGVSEIELDVWELNQKGISFYEKLGYKSIRRRLKFSPD